MECCTRHVTAAQRCFGWMSKMYEWRYRSKGLDENQQLLVSSLENLGLDGVTLLEVGCGVGALHQELLELGAASATGIDLAPRMLEVAESRARDLQLEDRTDYLQGDFVELSSEVDTADFTVLDKVVCCYPEPAELMTAVMSRTRKAVALTFPRKHFFSELSNKIWNDMFWLMRSDFRSFVHDPAFIRESIESWGFKQVFDQDSPMWHTQVYASQT